MAKMNRTVKATPAMQSALQRQASERAKLYSAAGAQDLAAQTISRAARMEREPVRGARAGHDGEAPALAEPRGMTEQDRAKAYAMMNMNVCRLDWLLAQKVIATHQASAGKQLIEDCYHGGHMRMQSASAVLSGAGGTGDAHPTDRRLKAGRAYRDALDQLAPIARGMIEMVVLNNVSVGKAGSHVARECAGLSFTHAVGALQCALDQLAMHYGMVSAPRGRGAFSVSLS